MRTKLLISLIMMGFCMGSNALVIPKSNRFDERITSQKYNSDDVIAVKTTAGYLTSLIFSENEKIEDAVTGFDLGWDIKIKKNIIYIKPVVNLDQASKFTANQLKINNQWNTNLLVKTNKHFYTIDLQVVDKDKREKNVYKIKFQYPEETKKTTAKNETKAKVSKELRKYPTQKNWNFDIALKNKISNSIAPDFIYSDDKKTYLGFKKNKAFSPIYKIDNGHEIIVNYYVDDKYPSKKYKLIIVHAVAPILVLKANNKKVGIFNNLKLKNIATDTSNLINSTKIKRSVK